MALEFATRSDKLPLKLRLLRLSIAGISRISPPTVARYGFKLFITPKRRPIREEDRKFLSTARRFSLPYGDFELVAYSWGAGKRVLLVHGWQANAARMRSMVQPLVDAGYEVIAFDAPAHGESTGSQVDLVQFGEAALHVMHSVGGVYGVVAHSLGAAAVATVLSTHKHLRVAKTVLIGAVDSLSSMLNRYSEGFGLTERVHQEIAQIIEERLGKPPAFYSNPDLLQDYPDPLLIVHDQDDKVVPFQAGVAIASKAPTAKLIATSGLGHRQILRNQQTIRQIIDFLDDA